MTGFSHGVRLACRLDFPVGGATYIFLIKVHSLRHRARDYVQKIEAETLISIAFTEGDYLTESWKEIFTCISRLSRLEQFSEGLHLDEDFFGQEDNKSTSEQEEANKFTKLKVLEKNNAALVIGEARMRVWRKWKDCSINITSLVKRAWSTSYENSVPLVARRSTVAL